MIGNTANPIAPAIRTPHYFGQVSMDGRSKGGGEPWLAALCAEHEVHEDVSERLRHG